MPVFGETPFRGTGRRSLSACRTSNLHATEFEAPGSMQLPLRAWRMRYRPVHSPKGCMPKPSVRARGVKILAPAANSELMNPTPKPMKTFAFVLSFVLSYSCGSIVEDDSRNLYIYAKQTLGGKPFPDVTEWVFNTFAKWGRGSIVCLFLIPWALLLLYSLLGPRGGSSVDRGIRLLFGFLCFALTEAFLLLLFMVSSLHPFVPFYLEYLDMLPPTPASAYIPHFILFSAFAVVIAVASWQAWQRSKNAKASTP